MLLLNFHSGFKDELVTTGLVVAITVAGSFYFLSSVIIPSAHEKSVVLGLSDEPESHTQPPTPTSNPANSATSISQFSEQETEPSTTPSPSPSPSPTPSPTATPNSVEIPYGANQVFENDSYKLSFSSPVLVVTQSRLFKVQVVLANKSVSQGFTNNLYARVTRDGQTIIEAAPMSISEVKTVKPGEQITFTATLSVIEGTQIDRISFKPGSGIVDTNFTLAPVY